VLAAHLPTLHERTLLMTLLPLGLMVVCIAGITIAVAQRALIDYAASRDVLVLNQLAETIVPELQAGNHTQVREAMRSTVRSQELSQAWLVNADGIVQCSTDSEAEGTRFPSVNSGGTLNARAIDFNGQTGRLLVRGDGRLLREITTVVALGAGLALAVGVVVTAWLVTRLSRTLAEPLAHAAAAAAAMADGDFRPAQDLPDSGVREWERLRASLGHTAQRLSGMTAELEGRVAARTAELAVANQRAESARALAEEASQAKSLFLACMSHELRTPLNAIIGYSEMMQEELVGREPTSCQDLARITTASRHLLTLINDILDYTKFEAGRMQVACEHFEVRQVVEDAVTLISPLVARPQVELQVAIDPRVTSAVGDAMKLRQIITNLLGNAVKFTTEGLIELAVATDLAGTNLVVTVRDTGPGIQPELLPRLFQPFTTGSGPRQPGGTGLGLAICRHSAQQMGGSISCDSIPGRGTTFRVTVPVRLDRGTVSSALRQAVTTRRLAKTATLEASVA
jgi:signal transduction histidine kinase